MRKPKSFLIIYLLLTCLQVSAQKNASDKPVIKFGEVSVSDFDTRSTDPDASAIVLADIGSYKVEGGTRGYITTSYKRFQRIKINNKNGFNKADFQLELYNVKTENNKSEPDQLEGLEAVTYNLSNGTVNKVPLDKAAIFYTKYSKQITLVKFTLPNIKEGSIIECKYSIRSASIENMHWNFQAEIPTLFSQFDVSIPSFFRYVLLKQGSLAYNTDETKTTFESFTVVVPGRESPDKTEILALTGNVYNHQWVLRNVPAIKTEAFTSTVQNYLQRVDFQLKEIVYPDFAPQDRMGTWKSFAHELLVNQYFGSELNHDNYFAGTEISNAIGGATTEKDKALNIYKYVRDNFECTNHNSIFLTDNLKTTFNKKSGNDADINLMLTFFLRKNGIDADPVLISTKENGKLNENFPFIEKFNYVIVRAKVDDKFYLLDATNKDAGFGKLAADRYNGSGRLIAEDPIVVPMYSDSLRDGTFTSVNLMNQEGNNYGGTLKSQLGNFETFDLRNLVRKQGSELFVNNLKKQVNPDITITNTVIEGVQDKEMNGVIGYDLTFSVKGDLIYFNPKLTNGISGFDKNPFVSADRQYPIEMPSRKNDTYVLNMEIPKGYTVDQLPKSALVKLNEGEGFYEYTIQQAEDKIQMRIRLVLNRATFGKDDYKNIRDFYAFLIAKENEMIVFKKIK